GRKHSTSPWVTVDRQRTRVLSRNKPRTESNMTDIEQYDLVVLGSGKAGKLLAWTLAAEGARVAVIERQYVGGACPNIACLPSKNIIHSAKVASYLRRGAEFGIAPSTRPIDMVAVRDRKRKMVDR